jgi:hypothetical protein
LQAGINNDSSFIKLGSGEDGLFGEALAAGATSASGVFSLQGEIDAGAGEDFVFGLGESQGGQQVSGVALVSSRLRLGSGEDMIQGLASGGLINAGVFVDQNSVINAGTGEDSLLGWGLSTGDNSVIRNFGLIKMGRGSDLVDASFAGFSGDGLTNLGAGDDHSSVLVRASLMVVVDLTLFNWVKESISLIPLLAHWFLVASQ